jgi:predicted O-linked N-acetylglucosamine transferase (SPINDLY family)
MARVAELFAEAVRRHRGGDPDGAVPLYRQVVQLDPAQAQAWYLLGAACRELGRLEEAEASLEQALRLQPERADVHNHLGVVRARQGKLLEAAAAFRQAVHLQPDHAEAARNLEAALRRQGDGHRQADAAPRAYQALRDEGRALRERGMFAESADCLRRAVALKPDDAEAHNLLGITLALQGKPGEAEACFREALLRHPGSYRAHSNLGNVCKARRQFAEAQACYEQALRLCPDFAEGHCRLGDVLVDQGESEQAQASYQEALRLKPDHVEARFGLCFAQLRILSDSEEEIARCRDGYSRELERLAADLPLDRPEAVAAAARAVGHLQPFLLAYQGHCDRALQATYGRLLCRIMAARYPQWVAAPPRPPLTPGRRLRVGIVSGFFHRHSNWKIPIRGWVENLDRGRFELFGYYTGSTQDAETVAARRVIEHFVENLPGVEDWCHQIRGASLDVLIYPETGMDPMAVKLAALRLAPVQCVSWGHPETSGLPTIDYFLSSDLMEPPDAQEHYTEELVRLANLSVHYTLIDTPQGTFDLAARGVRPGAVRYLCCQSLFKYLPQFDAVFCRIAAAVPEAQFLFLDMGRGERLTEQFRRRLHRAFARAGLDSGRHVVILPHLDSGQYQAVNQAADVFLDSIGWSGCNSTLEALACGLPVVTLPGALMRGRHSLAILRMMGVGDTLARDLDDYVALAVRLGRDMPWRQALRARVLANLDKVFRDPACIRSLERFLEEAVRRGDGSGPAPVGTGP